MIAATALAEASFERLPDAPALRLAVVSVASPGSQAGWSGTPHAIVQELRRRFPDVVVIDTPRLDVILARATKLARFGLLPIREPLVSAWFRMVLSRRLRAIAPDVVVVIAAEPKVAGLAGLWPMVLISDAFFATIVDYYPRYARLRRRVRIAADRQQRRLLDSGIVVLLSSRWAASAAAEAYHQPRSRFIVAPFGANLEPARPPPHPSSHRGALKLLFVGYDWRRKGGALAVATLGLLRERLGDVELHVVGCRPPREAMIAGVHCHGRLRKDRASDVRRLQALFSSASFLFTPSRQEAYGLVFAEACAFGVPPVAVDTGGVGEIIRHGVNGLLLAPSATAADLAAAIALLWANPVAYAAMRRAARLAFEDRLNWRSWGDALEGAVGQALRG